jgi:anti-sigma factor RsiW
MQNMNERPICHRSEDLVTYLYGEANDADAKDFAAHMRLCDACRSEFAIFQQVHDSILQWRSEALGAGSLVDSSATTPAAIHLAALTSHQPRLSAFAAVREFFSVSPLWLRGATALASLVFCVLVIFAVSRYWTKSAPTMVNDPDHKVYTPSEFQAAVNNEVERRRVAAIKQPQTTEPPSKTGVSNSGQPRRVRKPNSGSQSARLPQKRLTRKEREQLAADLRLFPSSDEDDLPFVLPNELDW